MASFPCTPKRSDFRIAIVCPLVLEAEVVKPLFDRVYDPTICSHYGNVPGDTNRYTLGRLGKYDVVLVHMADPGKAIAASVAGHLKMSYPAIELAFLIGICGGVPALKESESTRGRRDVFLGDVIISSGVVQYDLGKRLPQGFIRKDTLQANLGSPSQEIRSFLAQVKVWHARLSDRHSRYFAEIRSRMNVPYPGKEKDVLFISNYQHKSRECECELDAHIDESVIARRHESSTSMPFIHFGLLASGDTVMKSGKDRDEIADRERVIGFEMEGAGIWDNLPCLLVKGVSDYADSHKNDKWQYYAAASAAACMRALLDETPFSIVPSSKEPDGDPDKSRGIGPRMIPAGEWDSDEEEKKETWLIC